MAGSGKTFLLGQLLTCSKHLIVYLAKTRLFVERVKNEYQRYQGNKLQTYTFDAFMMRRLNIRHLDQWIAWYRHNEQVTVTQDDTRCIYFVDEYGMIEAKAMNTLRRLLAHERLIVVGDSYQQSAIEESEDQPINTRFSSNMFHVR